MLKAGPWSVTGHYSHKNTGCARTHGDSHGCTDKGMSPPSPTENISWEITCYWIVNKSHIITRFCHPIPSFDSEPREAYTRLKAFCIHSWESFTSFWRLLLPLSSCLPFHATSCSSSPWTVLAPWPSHSDLFPSAFTWLMRSIRFSSTFAASLFASSFSSFASCLIVFSAALLKST